MDLERVRDLERLGTLHARGVLDDDEFADAKAQVLARRDTEPAQRPRRGHEWWVPAAIVAMLAAVLVVVAVSASGPDRLTVTEYEEATLAAHRTAVSTIAREGMSPSEARAAVVGLASELDGLEPPEQAEPGHELLVAAYREHVEAIDELVSLVGAASDVTTEPSTVDAAEVALALLGSGRAIVAARRDLDAAHDRLAEAGVDVVTLAHPAELLAELA